MRRRTVWLSVTLASCLVASGARAQDASTTGAATTLFDEAAKLMEEGRYDEACPKLARSQELAPNGGTLFALAECYEKTGKVASAWVAYNEAAIRARAAKKPGAARAAEQGASRLAPRVSRLTLEVPETSRVDGLVLTLDARTLSRAEWGVGLPLDPGEHAIAATAPGRQGWSARVRFGPDGEQRALTVPVLEPEAPPVTPEPAPAPAPVLAAPPPAAPAEGAPRGGTQRALGLALGGLGLAGVAVGAVFGLQASSKNDEAASHCRGTLCDPEGIRLDREGRDAATVSTIAFVAGGGRRPRRGHPLLHGAERPGAGHRRRARRTRRRGAHRRRRVLIYGCPSPASVSGAGNGAQSVVAVASDTDPFSAPGACGVNVAVASSEEDTVPVVGLTANVSAGPVTLIVIEAGRLPELVTLKLRFALPPTFTLLKSMDGGAKPRIAPCAVMWIEAT